MSQLKLESTQVQLVKDNELANFITAAYSLPKRYELVAIEEMSNGDYSLFDVKPEALTQHEVQQLETLRNTGYVEAVTDVVLKDLCNKGWLAPGKYLVHAFW